MEGTLKPENSQARRQKENYHPPEGLLFLFLFLFCQCRPAILYLRRLVTCHPRTIQGYVNKVNTQSQLNGQLNGTVAE
jgi:hypothetical protein